MCSWAHPYHKRRYIHYHMHPYSDRRESPKTEHQRRMHLLIKRAEQERKKPRRPKPSNVCCVCFASLRVCLSLWVLFSFLFLSGIKTQNARLALGLSGEADSLQLCKTIVHAGDLIHANQTDTAKGPIIIDIDIDGHSQSLSHSNNPPNPILKFNNPPPITGASRPCARCRHRQPRPHHPRPLQDGAPART